MPRVCTVCQHPRIHDIDVWIVQGVSASEITRRTGLGNDSIRRHRQAGMHLTGPKERLAAEQEATVRRRVNAVVRARSNRVLQKQAAGPPPPKPDPPPPPPPPPPAKPVPVNRPGKLFTWEEVQELRRQAAQRMRDMAWARRQGRRQPDDPPSTVCDSYPWNQYTHGVGRPSALG
jgi:hypothetical protein